VKEEKEGALSLARALLYIKEAKLRPHGSPRERKCLEEIIERKGKGGTPAGARRIPGSRPQSLLHLVDHRGGRRSSISLI